MNGTGQAVATNRHTSNSQQRGFGPSRTARALLVALVAVPSLLIGLACSESVPTTQPRPIATIEAGYTPTPPPTERGPGFPPPARPTSTAAGSQPGLQVLPSVDEVFVNESVDFLLTDTETGELVERPSWRIVSFHNVPGDRGIMRSDGRYTAPRIAPLPAHRPDRRQVGGPPGLSGIPDCEPRLAAGRDAQARGQPHTSRPWHTRVQDVQTH